MNHFWKEFQDFNNCTFPKFIKDILNLCAIDKTTLEQIDEKTITEIEKIVNQKKSILIKSPYAKAFEKDEEFKFLYGHRLLLLSLPQKLAKFREFKKKNKQKRKEILKELKSSTNVDTETISLDRLDQIKKTLLVKLNNFAKGQLPITENEVKKFNAKGNHAYCVVKCPYCKTEVPCTYLNTWKIFNFCNHVRKFHLEKSVQQNKAPNPAFRTARSSVLSELNSILR